MAQLVLGVGSSHGITLHSQPEDWLRIGQGDATDPRYNYEELLKNAKPDVEDELTLDKRKARHASNQAGLQKLTEVVAEANLDAIILLAGPHRMELWDHRPVFGVFRSEFVPSVTQSADRLDPDARWREGGRAPVEIKQRPGHPELADHLLNFLIEDDFDVASTEGVRDGTTLDEAFTFLYERFVGDGGIPMVPFIVSRYIPQQATPRRCYALGGALRRAVEAWDSDSRVGILASGGLSHQIIDEELDQMIIGGLTANDKEQLYAIPRDRLNRAAGTAEALAWVAVSGAMEPLGMTLVNYSPCYRSVAATGHGVTQGYWKES